MRVVLFPVLLLSAIVGLSGAERQQVVQRLKGAVVGKALDGSGVRTATIPTVTTRDNAIEHAVVSSDRPPIPPQSRRLKGSKSESKGVDVESKPGEVSTTPKTSNEAANSGNDSPKKNRKKNRKNNNAGQDGFDAQSSNSSSWPQACGYYFSFSVTFDDYPEDFRISLQNYDTNATIWDKSEHKYNESFLGAQVVDSVCVKPGCYLATIYDVQGDGLTFRSDGTGRGGSFLLRYANATIASYVGRKNGCFYAYRYKFGQTCEFASQLVLGGSCLNATTESDGGSDNDDFKNAPTTISPASAPPTTMPPTTLAPATMPPTTLAPVIVTPPTTPCETFQFDITLDAHPEDVDFTLVDGSGVLLWNQIQPYPPEAMHTTMLNNICLDPNDCYTFTIYDDNTYPLGLTEGEPKGSFALSWGGAQIATYYGDTDGCYRRKWYKFGNACAAFEIGIVPAGGTCPV